MKRFLMVLGVILVVGIAGIIGMNKAMSSPLSREEVNEGIEQSLEKFITKNEEVSNVVLRVYADSKGYEEAFAVGSRDNGEPVSVDSRYHSASIGKTFVTVMCYMLQEEGVLNLDDPISDYLEDNMLDKLFVYEGIDYRDEVTIRHLLTHTSGVNDWFEGEVVQGETFATLMLQDLDKYWTEEELIDFTRENQVAVGKPGETFCYSDTGYGLLLFMLEEASGMSVEALFYQAFFEPLQMRDTSLMLKSEPINQPAEEMLPMCYEGVDLSKKNALSMGNTDGGIITTTKDLLIFFRALHEGKLISDKALEEMKVFDKTYEKGIQYGVGMMQFDFGQLSPFLSGMPNVYGGVGASGAFMMYDEVNDTFIIMNVGVLGFVEESTMELINILMLCNRMQ
ncbi:MAG: serine hydrolase domain-containing protein [Cellulosilyticaceae bacterium]